MTLRFETPRAGAAAGRVPAESAPGIRPRRRISLERRLLAALLTSGLVAGLAGPTFAQDEGGTSADAVSELGTAEREEGGLLSGAGVRVGESLVLHPNAEIQTGYQSNVFYQDDSEGSSLGAALMRIGVGGSLMTHSRARLDAAEAAEGQTAGRRLDLRADLNLTWNQYLTTNDVVMEQSNLGVGALFEARVNPESPLSFGTKDAFVRDVRPPQGVTDETVTRDKNELTLLTIFKPGGGAIQGQASYTFSLDIFERSRLSFANRLAHTFALGGRWQWLPKTQFHFDASVGIVSPTLETTDVKSGSIPLKLWIGTSTLVTPRLGAVIRLGYGNAFYEQGPNFSSYLAQVELRAAILPNLGMAGGYIHDYSDSLVANFYEDHALFARLGTQIGGRLLVRLRGELRFRSYDYGSPGGGPVEYMGIRFCGDEACTTSDRDDVLGRIDGTADYQLKDWLFAGASYTFQSDSTDFYIQLGSDPSTRDSSAFVWHEIMLKASAKF